MGVLEEILLLATSACVSGTSGDDKDTEVDETDTVDTEVVDTDPTDDAPTETWVEVPELEPDENGVYQLAFGPTEIVLDDRRFCLRTYNGMVPAPTIRVPAGTDRKIRIDLENQFEQYDYRLIAGKEGATEAHCNDFNLTNLHFHGGHIQPEVSTLDPDDLCTGEGCATEDGGYHGDAVLIHVEALERAQYRWDLDEDDTHHSGTQWYHPHIHGSTAVQVTNGSAGAFIVEGAIDAIPEMAAARERLMFFSQIPIDSEHVDPLEDDEVCNGSTVSVNNFLGITEYMHTLINGVKVPRLVTPPGQIERWRFVHGGNPDELGLSLHASTDDCTTWAPLPAMDMVQYAHDGITMPQFFTTDTSWMSPGYRVDVLLAMPDEDTTLCLVERRVRDVDGTAVAIVQVDTRAGAPTSTTMPAEADVVAEAIPITFTAKMDGVSQEISCENTAARPYDQRVVLLVPETDSLDDEALSEDLFSEACDPAEHPHSNTGSGDPSPIPGDQAICQCPSPNINCRKFDARRSFGYRADRVMTVDTSEKWELTAYDGHPFHIHINPFLVCPTDSNKEPPFAHWRDTYWVQFEDTPRQILTNFKTFHGKFVLHCHKLNHEDEGMMELVEICAEGDEDCLCLDHDAAGECISMNGCMDDDLQCQFAALATESYPLPPPPTPEICGDGDPPTPPVP